MEGIDRGDVDNLAAMPLGHHLAGGNLSCEKETLEVKAQDPIPE